MPDPKDLIFDAAAFAAYAHRHGQRKDGKTPYVSHVFRVCLVVRHIFGFDDARMLAAALLHDTIEDTTTDYDDIVEKFGPVVARWVAHLTKNKSLPDEEREALYCKTLGAAEWQVKVCKLADIYDNLGDCASMTTNARRKTCNRSRVYLDALRQNIAEQLREPLRLVEERLACVEAGLTA